VNGLIWVERADGLSSAHHCECVAIRKQRSLVNSANIPALFADCSFDNFNAVDEAARHNMNMSRRFAIDYPISPADGLPGLIYVGPPSRGKTHLAAAVANALLARGIEVKFFAWLNFLDHVKNTYDRSRRGDPFDYEVKHIARDAEVLLLDDLGSSRYSPHDEDLVTTLLGERYNQRRATIITTNLSDSDESYAELMGQQRRERNRQTDAYLEDQHKQRSLEERIGDRARARLREMCKVIRMEGEDYRKIIAKEGRKPRLERARP
jgi:DNA replication protein DnaC